MRTRLPITLLSRTHGAGRYRSPAGNRDRAPSGARPSHLVPLNALGWKPIPRQILICRSASSFRLAEYLQVFHENRQEIDLVHLHRHPSVGFWFCAVPVIEQGLPSRPLALCFDANSSTP